MTYKAIFVDSDILLDLLLTRAPYDHYSELVLEESKLKHFNIYTSTLVFANIHYLLVKNFNKQIAKDQLKTLSGIIKILSFETEELKKALNSEHADFEDTVQYFIAKKHNCEMVISRNIKHYKKFDIPVLTAEQFLRTL